MPIGNGLTSLLVWRVTRELFERHRKLRLCVLDEYEHLRHAVIFCCQANYLDFDADFQR